ncbi:MAG: TetR/AcrR family transcriptional regulator [Bacillota bacterium]
MGVKGATKRIGDADGRPAAGAVSAPYIGSRTANEALLDEKRMLIEAAATRCFSECGYSGTTIEQIAMHAGMSVGSIYRYVTRKQDILLLVFKRLMDLYESVLTPVIDLPLPPDRKLFEAMRAYYGIIDREPDRALIAYRESWALDKAGRSYIKQRELETNRYFEEIIGAGIDQGAFRPVDAHLVAYDIVLLGHMWALKGWHFRRLFTLDEYVRRQFELVMAHLTPPQ